MRFDRYNFKIVEQATTKLCLGEQISDRERLNLVRYFATAAKNLGDHRKWHNFVSVVDNYENIPEAELAKLDKSLVKYVGKLEIPQISEED